MSELGKRVVVAVPAAAAILWLCWLGGWYFVGTIIAAVMIIQHEISEVLGKAGFRTDPFFPYTIALWILLIPHLPYAFEIGIAIFLLFAGVQVFNSSATHIQQMVSTLFAGFYAPLGLLMLLMVRGTGASETGFILTLSLFLMVWGNDVFAYFGGKSLGKRLMAPQISPKKTWEGFAFGFIGAAAGLAIAFYAVPIVYPITFMQALPAAALVSVFGPLGDLSVSKLKRAAGVKDTSNLLPGHGGLLDRLDALILVSPAFYLYLHLLTILGYASF